MKKRDEIIIQLLDELESSENVKEMYRNENRELKDRISELEMENLKSMRVSTDARK
jgi:hypothetical protein